MRPFLVKACVAATLAVLQFGIPAGGAQAQEAPGVIVAEAQLESFPLAVEALGDARANEAVDIRPEITARISAIRFEEGQQVEAGDVLVELEDSEPLADLAAARAALVDSESQFRRSSELYRTQAVSESQLQQLEARRDADQAAVAAAEARLADTVVRAPFAGCVGLRRVSAGSLVSPETVITTLDDTRRIKVDFNVPEVYLALLEPGLPVTVTSVSWPGEVFEGEVTGVDTRVDRVSRTVAVRGILPNPEGRLRPGMFLNVTLFRQDARALMIPEQALVPERSEQFVFRVDGDGVAHKVLVRTGRRRPGEVEILEGLEPGDRVVAEGTQKARDGEPVRVIERGTP